MSIDELVKFIFNNKALQDAILNNPQARSYFGQMVRFNAEGNSAAANAARQQLVNLIKRSAARQAIAAELTGILKGGDVAVKAARATAAVDSGETVVLVAGRGANFGKFLKVILGSNPEGFMMNVAMFALPWIFAKAFASPASAEDLIEINLGASRFKSVTMEHAQSAYSSYVAQQNFLSLNFHGVQLGPDVGPTATFEQYAALKFPLLLPQIKAKGGSAKLNWAR